MDKELLAEHSEGIIAASGCLGGEVAQLLAPDASREEGNSRVERDYEAALAAAAEYQDIFGKDNFFIEVMDHGIAAQHRIMDDLLSISKAIDAPLLAANDCPLHVRVRGRSPRRSSLHPDRRHPGPGEPIQVQWRGFYLKTAEEMRKLFPTDRYPGACDNTLWIAERAEVDLEFGKILLPTFPVPAGYSEASYLRELVIEGAKQRYGDCARFRGHLPHRLRVVGHRRNGLSRLLLDRVGPDSICEREGNQDRTGSGSAAGSIVAYCLRITGLDPLEYGLIFERFLNPGRRQMPDIDMDFDERYRSEMIRYCADRYGSDHVAQIITFSTIKGRQAVRDAARVLGHPYGVGDRVAKAMPPAILGVDATLDQCLVEPLPEADATSKDHYTAAAGLRDMIAADPDAAQVVETARGLEGLRRQDSIHAAAVVISPLPLEEIVPTQRKGEDGEVVTQYEMHAVEELGLLKMDFLGLRNLSTIERALELIEETTGERIDIDSIALDDPAVYEMLQRGDSIGVFQLEGNAMRSLMRNLRPDRFEDIVALVSLYRPGPLGAGMHNSYANRKNGREEVVLLDSELGGLTDQLEPILGDTYGIMVYQEQVMQVAQVLAGFSMVEADMLRKAMGKKIPAVMAEQEELFTSGAISNGHPEALARRVFELIGHFAGYGFNKSHAAAYGLVAYQTAWLKAHHPPNTWPRC